MTEISPYLNFNGNAEEAFNFYKSVFGGEFSALQRFKDVPGNEMAENEQERIMHIALPLGKGHVLMASDIAESAGHKLNEGNNFYISINTKSEAEATRIFNALSAGGKVEMPLEKMFWGAYFGMFKDKFGIQWMVSYNFSEEKQAG